MKNQPYLPLYTGDWKKDPELSICSPATRGIWVDLLCSLHDGHIGQVTGTASELARLCRCDTAECIAALLELQNKRAANISERDGVFTVTCRRMKSAYELSQKRAIAGSKKGAKQLQSLEYESESEGRLKVKEFTRTLNLPDSDGDWFFWKCHGNGWTNGGKPIRNWKATIRSWQSAGYLPSQKEAVSPRRSVI